MNRFSRAREYSKPVSPFDMDFIGKAMAYKQNKVDANKALIQDTIDNIMSLTIDKPEARDYLYNRVEQLVTNVNAYSGSDLSNDNVARNISAYINNALDDTVLNAYAGTMEGRKTEQYYDQLQRDDPDRYNERNKAFDMAPYYRWIQDGKAGSRLAPLQISKYVDYSKEAQDVLKQMREAQKNGMEWQYPDPDNPGYFITKKIDRMTPDEVQQAVYNSLGQDAHKQIFIDGWYMANTQPELFTPEALNQYVSGVNGDYDRSKAVITAQMAGAVGNSERYDELRRSYDLLDARRTEFNNKARQIFSSGNREEMGAFMVENNFLRGMGQTWSYDKSSVKMETDPSYWSKKNYERNLANDQVNAAKIAADLKLRERTLEMNERKTASEIALNQSKIAANNAKIAREGGGGGPVNYSGVGVITDVETTGSQAPFTAEDYIQAKLNTYGSRIQESVGNILKDLTPENREALNAWIEDAKASGDPEYSGLSDEEMVVAYFDKNGGATNDMLTDGSALDSYSSIKDIQIQMDSPMKVIKSYDAYQEDVLAGAPEAVALYAQNNDIPVVYPNGTFGYTKDINNATVANALGLEFLDEVFGANVGVGVNPANLVPGVRFYSSIDAKKASSPAMSNLLSKISEMNGEHVTFNDVFMDAGENGWIIRPREEGEPYTVTMLRGLLDYKIANDRKDVVSGAADVVLNLLKPGSLAGTLGAALPKIFKSEENQVKDLVKKVSDPKVFADMAEAEVKIRTPKEHTVSKTDKPGSLKRQFYDKIRELYIASGTYESYGNALTKLRKDKIPFPDTVSLRESVNEDGTIGYTLVLHNDERNAIPISAETLAANNILIDNRDLIEAKDLERKVVDVNVGADTNTAYSKHLINMGIPGIASKMEIMNRMLDTHSDIFRRPPVEGEESSSSYIPTEVGEEAVAFSEGIDKFQVGAQGYVSNGVQGIKVFIYDGSQKSAEKTPIYQYTLDNIPYANETMKRLSVCPQYFVIKGADLALAKYKAGLARGTQAGKDDWNKFVNVVKKK